MVGTCTTVQAYCMINDCDKGNCFDEVRSVIRRGSMMDTRYYSKKQSCLVRDDDKEEGEVL